MTIAVGFTKGLVPILSPTKPQRPEEVLFETLTTPPYMLFGLLMGLTGLALPVARWWRHGRDWWWPLPAKLESNQQSQLKPLRRKPQIVVEYEPPENLRPAQIGVLIDQRADTIDISSSIIDLASRGYLSITELPKSGLLGSSDYQMNTAKNIDATMLPYEQKLLKRMFNGKKSILLSSLKNSFYDDLSEIKADIYDGLTKEGYFVTNPKSIRTMYVSMGIGLILLGIALGIVSYNLIWPGLLTLSILPLSSGTVLMIIALFMPQRTALGYELYRRALGYKLFISTAEKYRQRFFESQNTFTQVLPYAIMFGLTAKFAQAMEQIGYQPAQPSWYSGINAFNLGQLSRDLNSISKALSTTISSAPSSSGSGGGGSSGGGFGGGGGGSW
jgi:uncharacterized membrane protein